MQAPASGLPLLLWREKDAARDEIGVKTTQGTIRIKASTHDGFLGVHPVVTRSRFAGGFSITHIPTGFVVTTLPNPHEANYLLKRLSDLPVDWGTTEPNNEFSNQDWNLIFGMVEEFYGEKNVAC
jgi:hypothetical protein